MTRWQPPDDPYVGLTDDAALEAAIQARQERRELTERAAELAGWIGTLRDLAEAGTHVALRSRTGRLHRGAVRAVAEDHIVVQLPGRQLLFIRHDAVSAVRPDPELRLPPAMGERDRAQDRTLLEVLDRAVGDRARVTVTIEGQDDVVQGELVSVGEDVVTMRPAGREVSYLRAGAILEAVVER